MFGGTNHFDDEAIPNFLSRKGFGGEFIEIKNRKEINFRVYERGSGETLACGTGATAAVVAGNLLGKLDEEVLVHLLGGELKIFYDKESKHAFMTGEAREVFSGIWEE